MKSKVLIGGIIILFFFISGCSYMIDRGRDFTDIITISAEVKPFNASVQLGPILTGVGTTGLLTDNGNGYGLRSGTIGGYEFFESQGIVVGEKGFYPNDERGFKGYNIEYEYITGLLYSVFGEDSKESFKYDGPWQTLLQFEISVGFFIGARCGVNFGELIDFMIGWSLYDICMDDEN